MGKKLNLQHFKYLRTIQTIDIFVYEISTRVFVVESLINY